MKEYDDLGQKWLPYLMFFHSPNYVSNIVNTDSKGFRFSYKNNELIKIFKNREKEVSLFIGGSTAFGVGSTSDRKTIPSILNEKTNDLWLNFGGRAYSSTQELMLFMFYRSCFKKIKKIVIFSGLNNLILYFLNSKYSEHFGSFFFQSKFDKAMKTSNSTMSFKRNLLNYCLKPFLKKDFDHQKASLKDFANAFLFAKSYKKKTTHKNSLFTKINDHKKEKNKILYSLNRDIETWMFFAKSLNCEISYVLQPMANWISRKKSSEEKKIFAELDNSKNNNFRILAQYINIELYEWYKKQLEIVCSKNNLPFFDMNEQLSLENTNKKWLFVDRAHLTDIGNEVVSKILLETFE